MKSFLQSPKFLYTRIGIHVFSLIFIIFSSYFIFESQELPTSFKYVILLFFVAFMGFLAFLLERLTKEFKNQKILRDKVQELETKLEKLNAVSSSKSYYLSNLSHEMRTPLNNMIGMLNMLKETSLDNDQMAEVEIAQYSSEHLLQLVNMILDNHRFDKDVSELKPVVIDLETDLKKLFKVFEYQAWDKNLEFEYSFLSEKKSKFSLLGDLARIKQVLVNLFNNALKFTESGKINMTIHQTASEDDGQIVTFYVKDTGVGMSADKINKLNGVSKNMSDGMDLSDVSGVGLYVARNIVKSMGGELEIESKEGEGSVFHFSLQLKKTLSLKGETKETGANIFNELDNSLTVLVAEDNRIHQKVIKFLLEQEGVDCTFVKNGLEAVKLYNILDFDMVFMDIYMPEMDGHEATKAIKTSEKYVKNNIPIIAVSAGAFEADVESAKLSGVDDFLAKPIESNKLKLILNKYAKNSMKR